MQLNATDASQLDQIRQAVHQKTPFHALMTLCERLSREVEDRPFPSTYAGILLATDGRIPEAIEALRVHQDLSFNRVLADDLEARREFLPAATAFQQSAPYDIWTRTDFYRSHLAATLAAFDDFVRSTPPPAGSGCPTIVDIGPGNGVLLREMIQRLIDHYHPDQLKVILIEQSPRMLAAADNICVQSFSIPIQVTPVASRIQDLSPEAFAAIAQNRPIWFVSACLSLHHMPRELKIPTLNRLASLAAPCFLSEANGNHDLPEKNSPQLVASVARSYGFVIEDILSSPISQQEKKICMDQFVLTEVIHILSQDRSCRGDYHALIEEWQDIAALAGWDVAKLSPTSHTPEATFAFAMQLQPRL